MIAKQDEWGNARYQDPCNWGMVSGEWKWPPLKNGGDFKQPLGIGEYADWIYGDVLTHKAVRAKYLLEDDDAVHCPSEKKFADGCNGRKGVSWRARKGHREKE